MKILKQILNFRSSLNFEKYVYFFFFTSISFIFNFLLIYFANFYLTSEFFGIFYLGLTILNISIFSFQPVSYFFIRQISYIKDDKLQNTLSNNFLNFLLSINLSICTIILLIIFGLNFFLNLKSFYLLLILCSLIFINYQFEISRNFLEAKKNFKGVANIFLFWSVTKFFISCFLIYNLQKSFSGIFGILISTLLSLIIISYILVKDYNFVFKFNIHNKLANLRVLVITCCFYFITILIINLDIFLAYFLFDKNILSKYAASIVIGKSLIVFFNPFMKFFISNKDEKFLNLDYLNLILITLFLILFILIILSQFYLNTKYTLIGTNIEIYYLSLFSSSLICIFRFLAIKEYTLRNEKAIFFMLVPLIIFITFIYKMNINYIDLAKYFLYFSIIVLLYFSAILKLFKKNNE